MQVDGVKVDDWKITTDRSLIYKDISGCRHSG